MSLYKENGYYEPKVVYFSNNNSWSSYYSYQHSYGNYKGSEPPMKIKNFQDELMYRDYSLTSCSKKIKISNDKCSQSIIVRNLF